MDTRKLLIYSSTSILLHTILWLLLNKLDQPTKDLPREPLEWIEFPKTDHQNIEDKTSNTQNEHQQKETKSEGFTEKNEIANMEVVTKKYGIESGFERLIAKGTKPRSEYEKDFDSDFNGTYPELAQANAIGLKQYLKLSPSLETIRSKIQKQLGYPDDFLKERIKGTTQITLKLGEDGTIKEIISFRSDRDILCAYVLSIINFALRLPLPEKLYFENDMIISLKVHHNYDSVTPTTRDTSKVMKNLISFNLHRFVEPRLNQELKHVFTHYVPPIIPIPGGVFVDLYHIHKFVENWGKPTEKEKRANRLKQLKKLLEQSIQSKK